jgi:glucose/mannose-6-phosphate isomerase
MMDQLIAGFIPQLEEALAIGRVATLRPAGHPEHILVAGLGGSGIGADFVATFIRDECPLPFLVRKGYHVPAFVGPQTLAIASSYSGNTEETLLAYDQLKARGAHIICVASGGQLIDRATADGYDYVKVPAGSPSPRACLGYSLTVQLFILHKLGLIGDRTIHDLEASVALLRREAGQIREDAAALAARLHGKTAVIYCEDRLEPVAVRFRQQINENSKALCWHHVLPEMNHNELVGWTEKRDDLAVVFLRSGMEYGRNALRLDITRDIVGRYAGEIIQVDARGDSAIEQAMYLVHLADWTSWHLANLRGADALEVRVIDHLKAELGKVPL